MLRMPRILKTRGLLHIDSLIEKTMEKRIADVYLTEAPTARNCKGQNQTHSDRLHNRTEGVVIINTVLLSETASNETRLELVNRTIRTEFRLENPFTADNVSS